MNRDTLIKKCAASRIWKSALLIPVFGFGALVFGEVESTFETRLSANTSVGACWLIRETDWIFYACSEKFAPGSSCSSVPSGSFYFSCPKKSNEKPVSAKEGARRHKEIETKCPRGGIVWCNPSTREWLSAEQPAGTATDLCTGTYDEVVLSKYCKGE